MLGSHEQSTLRWMNPTALGEAWVWELEPWWGLGSGMVEPPLMQGLVENRPLEYGTVGAV
jgi:hypothetical protein